jgi:hypothetical protein
MPFLRQGLAQLGGQHPRTTECGITNNTDFHI